MQTAKTTLLALTICGLALACGLAAASEDPIPEGFTAKPGQTPPADWSAPGSAGFVITNPKDGAELVWIPPGKFTMGSSDAEQQWSLDGGAQLPWVRTESPQHVVRLSGFWMYRCEVTNGQFRRFAPNHASGLYQGEDVDQDTQPAAQLNWTEAADYCRWAGAALPSEAQWEYACRAGTTTMFPWGDDPLAVVKYANMADQCSKRKWPQWRTVDVDDGYVASSPVGSFQPNAWGLYDMIGNVWEWCNDWFGEDYYANSLGLDPPGPEQGAQRIVRGAAWDNWMANSRSAYRLRYRPDETAAYLGFRAMVPARVPIPPP
jgi:formylglycine-generating enzyme